MIEEIPIADLDPRQVKQLESADKVLQNNPTHTLEIYGAILKQSPGCLELRKKLRALQLKNLKVSSSGISGLFNKVTTAPFALRAKSEKDPKETLAKAEELINKLPSNVVAHQMLAEAAANIGMLETAVFAYETIQRIQPKDIKNLKDLGNAYIQTGNTEMAIATGNSIKQINPNVGDAEDM